jgi:hypothetical protein
VKTWKALINFQRNNHNGSCRIEADLGDNSTFMQAIHTCLEMACIDPKEVVGLAIMPVRDDEEEGDEEDGD